MAYGYQSNQAAQPYGHPTQQTEQQSQQPMTMSMEQLMRQAAGAPAFFTKDTQPGAAVTGIVESSEARQSTVFGTNQPAFFPSGDPKMELRITLKTQLHESPDDDGRRSVWIKFWGIQKKALMQAMSKAHAYAAAPGDTFAATYLGPDMSSKAPMKPKAFRYELVKKSQAGAAAQQAMGQPQPARNNPAPGVSQPVAQSTKPQYGPVKPFDESQCKALAGAGLSASQIAEQTGWDINQVETCLRPDEPAF